MPKSKSVETISLELGARSYDISIGASLLEDIGSFVMPLLSNARVFVVSESNVMRHQGSRLKDGLRRAGIESQWFVLNPGEATKSFGELARLSEDLLSAGIERSDTIIAFGGGVIGDLAGFAASILLRGVNFIQVPTTLLAQVDSSVGGKTGINTPQGKNLIGAFYQPKAVVIDIETLSTLPRRELLAGYAEIVKYGVIDDPDFFDWLEHSGAAICEVPGSEEINALRAAAIAHSCRAKARVVAEDEHEKGKRALLNLGHTFGHALEAECGYSDLLLHGEAVAIGMVMALNTSVQLKLAPTRDRDRVQRHFAALGMKTTVAEIGKPMRAETLIEHMSKDKKVEAGTIGFILGGIGSAAMHRGVDLEIIHAVLHDSLNTH